MSGTNDTNILVGIGVCKRYIAAVRQYDTFLIRHQIVPADVSIENIDLNVVESHRKDTKDQKGTSCKRYLW